MTGERVFIFDTTLRDGEQAAGASMNSREKLEIAQQLEALGVDIIEAGFPITSPGDFEAVRLISRELQRSTICALSHANEEAIDRAWEAIKPAKKGRIHIFLSLLHAPGLPVEEKPGRCGEAGRRHGVAGKKAPR